MKKILFYLCIITSCLCLSSCSKHSNNEDGCSRYDMYTGKELRARMISEGGSSENDQDCNAILPYWNLSLESMKASGISVEKIKIESEEFKDYDFYKISSGADKNLVTKYDEITSQVAGNMVRSPRSQSDTDFCSKNLTPRSDCPDCVNDLVAIEMYKATSVPGHKCGPFDYGCNLKVLFCKTVKRYAQNSNGRVDPYEPVSKYILPECINDLSYSDGYLVFTKPVLSCLGMNSQTPGMVSINLEKLCSKESIPKLYDAVIDAKGDENHPEMVHADITPVWEAKKLKLEYPENYTETKYLMENVDDILAIDTFYEGFTCSFEQ